MVTTIIKRDGRTAEFNEGKIAEAVERAFQACGAMQDRTAAEDIARKVVTMRAVPLCRFFLLRAVVMLRLYPEFPLPLNHFSTICCGWFSL